MTTARTAVARKTRVLIIAESAVHGARLRSLLSGHPELEVTTGDGDNVARQSTQAVIVLDAESERAFPVTMLPALRGGVIVMAGSQNLNLITHTFPREPIALLSPDCDEKQLVAAIRSVAAGLTVLAPETLELLIRTSPESIALEPGEEELTARETEVLHMMTAGLTNREIATTLGISENTVKFHIASIFGKLGTSTRTETVTEGIRRRLILL